MTARTIEEPNESGCRDDEAVRVLHQEIGLLPERYRSAVVLCYLEGLTHETAAERLGRPVGTVRSRLATARDRLRARLTRRGLAPAVIPALDVGRRRLRPAFRPRLQRRPCMPRPRPCSERWQSPASLTPEAIVLTEVTLKNMMITRWSFEVSLVCRHRVSHLRARAQWRTARSTREEGSPAGRLGDAGALVRESAGARKSAGQAPSPAPESNRPQEQGGAAEEPNDSPGADRDRSGNGR